MEAARKTHPGRFLSQRGQCNLSSYVFCRLVCGDMNNLEPCDMNNLEPATAHAASQPGREVVTQQGGTGIAARTEEPGCHSRTWTDHRKPVQN